MTENNDQNAAGKRTVKHIVPKILENGPVILFGFRRPPMQTSGDNLSSRENPDSSADENEGKTPFGE